MAKHAKGGLSRRSMILIVAIAGIFGVGIAFRDVFVPIISREFQNLSDEGQDVARLNPVVIENVTFFNPGRYAVSDSVLSTDPQTCGEDDWVAEVEGVTTLRSSYFDLRSRRSDVTVTRLTVKILDEVALEHSKLANCAAGGEEAADHFAGFMIHPSGKVSQVHSGAGAKMGKDRFSYRLTTNPLDVYASVEVEGPRVVTWQLVATYVVEGKTDQISIGEPQRTAGQPPGKTELLAYGEWTEEPRFRTEFERLQGFP